MFTDAEDLGRKVAYYLGHPEELERIAERARQRAVSEHTYRHRMRQLLETVVENNASDLHMCTGLPPVMRVDGELKAMRYTPMTPEVSQRMIYDILTDDQIQRFESDMELDCSYQLRKVARVRVYVF